MVSNGGWATLGPAVKDFIKRFDDDQDKAAMVTFATSVKTDVKMDDDFIEDIEKKVPDKLSDFEGATNSAGGLQAGFDEITATPVPAGQNISKVVVFFTDGLANTFFYSRSCSGSGSSFSSFALVRVGDTGSTFGLYKPKEDLDAYCTDNNAPPSCCSGFSQFNSVGGGTKPLNAQQVETEARLRAVTVAQNMRAQNITVYSVGLGGEAVDANFLRDVANDPASASFNKDTPVGAAFFPENANDLSLVFQTVAAKILLRLSK
jgi:hypothetical protein